MVALLVFTCWEAFWREQLTDSLSLEVPSYPGLGSRLSNAGHTVCLGSVSSLIALSMKDVNCEAVSGCGVTGTGLSGGPG